MKKLWLLIFYAIFPICVIAQQHTEYNRRGDDAVKRRDFSDARLFYSEGVPNCDIYSINQLTKIWLANEKMRTSMHNVMSRCFRCLSERAEANDTTAITKLILYYTEGIGIPQSTAQAQVWLSRLDDIRKPIMRDDELIPRERMKFFAGYSFSPLAPVGITIGGVGKRFGWYTRFKTNASFQSFDDKFTGAEPKETTDYLYYEKRKANSYAATAGLIVKCTSWLYTSIGVGYGNRELLYLYSKRDDTGIKEIGKVWYKNQDSSYNGVSAEIDCVVKLGAIYVSAGCNTLNFEYIDLNAGVGVFF